MKTLVISVRDTNDVFKDFERALGEAKDGTLKARYSISFDSYQALGRFLEHGHILICIRNTKPRSIYQLAKELDMDVSNLNKIIRFLEDHGAIRIKTGTVSGRKVKRPVVEYDRIEFRLAG